MVGGRARESESLGCIPSFAADSLGDLDQWLHPLHLRPENGDLMTVPRKTWLNSFEVQWVRYFEVPGQAKMARIPDLISLPREAWSRGLRNNWAENMINAHNCQR